MLTTDIPGSLQTGAESIVLLCSWTREQRPIATCLPGAQSLLWEHEQRSANANPGLILQCSGSSGTATAGKRGLKGRLGGRAHVCVCMCVRVSVCVRVCYVR